MEIRECLLCNKEFVPKRKNQKYCSMPHIMNCFHCGKEFSIQRAYPGRTRYSCGNKECKKALTEQTNLEKYGTKNVFQSEEIKDKIKQTNLKKYGVEHPSQNEKIIDKMHQTMIDKYGVKTALQSSEFKKKIKQTNLEKYGVDNPAKSEEIKDKIKQTNLKKYGVPFAFQAEKVKEKINKTNLEKYGTKTPRWHNKESREKAEQTNLKKYGHINPFGGESIKEKIQETNMQKYGAPWVTQAEEVKAKMKQSYIEKFGVDNPAKSEEIKEIIMKTNIERHGASNPGMFSIKNIEDYMNFFSYVMSAGKSVRELIEYFNVSEKTIRRKIIDNNVEYLFPNFYTLSSSERKIIELLEDNVDLDMTFHNKRVIKPQEVDIYLPKIKVGIEVSPTYTHNSKHGWGGTGKGLDKSYHYDKFKLADDNNIELITLFDWYDYKKVSNYVKSLVDKDINMSQIKLKETPYDKTMSTKYTLWDLELNPEVPDSDKVLSVYVDEKIAAIVFADVNGNSISISKITQSPEYPRDKLLISIINLLKERYSVIQVVTNSDITNGSILRTLDFNLTGEIEPSLIYMNDSSKEYVRSNNIVNKVREKIGHKSSIKGGDNNVKLLEQNGFLPVYDCGNRIFKFEI